MAALLNKQTIVANSAGLEQRILNAAAFTSLERYAEDVLNNSEDRVKFVAEANKVSTIKTIGWSSMKPSGVVASVAGAAINTGVVKLFINGTQVNEQCIQGYSQNSQAALFGCQDGSCQLGIPANQLPSFGEGFTCETTDEIEIKVTPFSATQVLWCLSVFGKESGTDKIVVANMYTYSTSSDQVALSYTPAANFTFVSYTVSAHQLGSISGYHVSSLDNMFLGSILGWCNNPETFSQPHPETTYGAGAIFINTWGIKMFEGQSLGFAIAKTNYKDMSEWHQFVMGTTTAIAAGAYTFTG